MISKGQLALGDFELWPFVSSFLRLEVKIGSRRWNTRIWCSEGFVSAPKGPASLFPGVAGGRPKNFLST